jgi:hypothetical protein
MLFFDDAAKLFLFAVLFTSLSTTVLSNGAPAEGALALRILSLGSTKSVWIRTF